MAKKTPKQFFHYLMSFVKDYFADGQYYGCCAISTNPGEYLFGTTGQIVTEEILNERYDNHYNKKMSRKQYDAYTNGWVRRKARVFDCQGLLDYFAGDNVTADYCYKNWCTEKGEITDEVKAYLATPNALGCAVFEEKDGKKNHVGFIVGNLNGDPLIVEARGIAYGVCMTRLSEREFTYWGRPSKVIEFPESPIIPVRCTINSTNNCEANTPRIRALQNLLTACGYACVPDGRIGAKTRAAFKAFMDDNETKSIVELVVNGETVFHNNI